MNFKSMYQTIELKRAKYGFWAIFPYGSNKDLMKATTKELRKITCQIK
jgi:hypothetical protein